MTKNLLLLFLLLMIISCNHNKNIRGHWHEYTNNNSDFGECIIIKDSTFSINKYTVGGTFEYYENFKNILNFTYYDSLIYQNYKIKKEFISINDSINWIKQKEDTRTFINDFSAGLKIKINPIIHKFSEKDTINNLKLVSQIFIGKLKDFAFQDGFKDQFNMQLNDKIENDANSLLRFLFIRNCHSNDYNYNYLIIPDAQISISYINNIRNLMRTINIKEKNIYFGYADTTKLKFGFKNIKEIDKFIK